MKKTSKGDSTNAREYRTLKKLAQHPNIVKLQDSYVGPAKELYFVMEYMNGGNLYQLIKQRREAERPLEHSKVRSILYVSLSLSVSPSLSSSLLFFVSFYKYIVQNDVPYHLTKRKI